MRGPVNVFGLGHVRPRDPSPEIEAKREALERAEDSINEAAGLRGQVQALSEELAALERRRDAYARLGPNHVQVPNPHAGPDGILLRPLESVHSGEEIAAGFDADIANLRRMIDDLESQIATLLAAA